MDLAFEHTHSMALIVLVETKISKRDIFAPTDKLMNDLERKIP